MKDNTEFAQLIEMRDKQRKLMKEVKAGEKELSDRIDINRN